MKIARRFVRFAFLGMGVAGLTACNMMGYDLIGGQFGDRLNRSKSWGKNTGTSGWVRSWDPAADALCVNGGCDQNCWPLPIGRAHLTGGVGTFGEPQGGAVLSSRGYGRRLASCPARFGVAGQQIWLGTLAIASTPGGDAYGGIKDSSETTDTDGNGIISGGGTNGGAPNFNHSPTCANANFGISQVVRVVESSIPNSAVWQDDIVCFNPAIPSDITPPGGAGASEHASTATTLGQTTVNYNGDTTGLIMQQAPGGDSSTFAMLPIELQADLLSSINTETDIVTDETGAQTIKLRVTGIRLYGASYSPRGVTATMNGGSFLGEVMSGPGGRLMAAWAADQIQRFVDAGGTSWEQMRASVTINDSAVIPISPTALSGGILARDFLPPSQALVDGLRRFATQR